MLTLILQCISPRKLHTSLKPIALVARKSSETHCPRPAVENGVNKSQPQTIRNLSPENNHPLERSTAPTSPKNSQPSLSTITAITNPSRGLLPPAESTTAPRPEYSKHPRVPKIQPENNPTSSASAIVFSIERILCIPICLTKPYIPRTGFLSTRNNNPLSPAIRPQHSQENAVFSY